MKFKVGVLIPHSKSFPVMGKDFIYGLKMALKDVDVEFRVEGIGLGADANQLVDLAQKLITQEEVFLITGLLGHTGVKELAEFISAAEEVLLYADMGATLPYGLNPQKGVYCNSFDLATSAHYLGFHLAEKGVKNIGVSTCYYDAGYGFVEALGTALQQTENCNFCGHFITPLHPRENESTLMDEFVDTTYPEVLFASHNAVFAKEHAEFMEASNGYKKTPIYAMPFSIEEDILVNYPVLFDGVKSVSTWYSELNNTKNNSFVEEYDNRYSKKPSSFSLLGYEQGLVIAHLMNQHLGKNSNSKQQIIQDLEIESPRGMLSYNKETHRTHFDHYEWELSYSEEDKKYYKKYKKLKTDNNLEFILNAIKTSDTSVTGGWFNAYLCQ